MPSGSIGLISQSGSLMASLISHAQDLGTGFSTAISIGNQADLEICDFIEYFLADDATRAICVYAEGLKDGRRFMALAEKCLSAGKPLLAVKAGNSATGARIAMSHTASLAGAAAVWEAVCREHGVVLLDDPEALIQCADFLIHFGAPGGDGVAALSPSGGTIAVTADRIAAAGLRLAELSPATCEALHQIVPPTRPVNPLDVGGMAREVGLNGTRRCYELLAEDMDSSAILIVVATTPQLNEKVRLWGKLALERGKPTALLLAPGSLVDEARATLRELGCPFVNRMDDALRVLKAAIEYGRALRAPRNPASPPSDLDAPEGFTAPAAHLTESEAKALLRLAGIATTVDRIVRNPEAAAQAAREIGYPVALKLSSRTLTHKSDVGGVKLGLDDDAAVKSAWHDIVEALAREHVTGEAGGMVDAHPGSVAHPGSRRESPDGGASAGPEHALECVVQTMVSGGIEVIVGSRWDAQFGAVVMAGAGGIWVEALSDTQLALAPVSRERAHALVAALRIWPLLAGGRGQARADIDTLTDVIVRVSWLAARLGPRLAELDINPLLVRRAEQGAIALDARAILQPPAAH